MQLAQLSFGACYIYTIYTIQVYGACPLVAISLSCKGSQLSCRNFFLACQKVCTKLSIAVDILMGYQYRLMGGGKKINKHRNNNNNNHNVNIHKLSALILCAF